MTVSIWFELVSGPLCLRNQRIKHTFVSAENNLQTPRIFVLGSKESFCGLRYKHHVYSFLAVKKVFADCVGSVVCVLHPWRLLLYKITKHVDGQVLSRRSAQWCETNRLSCKAMRAQPWQLSPLVGYRCEGMRYVVFLFTYSMRKLCHCNHTFPRIRPRPRFRPPRSQRQPWQFRTRQIQDGLAGCGKQAVSTEQKRYRFPCTILCC